MFPFDKLRAKREELDMTRDDLAERSGIPKRYVENLEQGRAANPTMSTITGLCQALGVPCNFFFETATDEEAARESVPPKGRPRKPDGELKAKRRRGK